MPVTAIEKESVTMMIDGFSAIRRELGRRYEDMKVADVAARLQALRQEIVRETGYRYSMSVLMDLFICYMKAWEERIVQCPA